MIQLSRTILSESINFLKLQKGNKKEENLAKLLCLKFLFFFFSRKPSTIVPTSGCWLFEKRRVYTARLAPCNDRPQLCSAKQMQRSDFINVKRRGLLHKKECLICKNKSWKQFRKVKERKERRGVLRLHFEKWKDIQCVVYKCDDRVIATILSPEIPLHAYHLPSFENHAMICIMLCALTNTCDYLSFLPINSI